MPPAPLMVKPPAALPLMVSLLIKPVRYRGRSHHSLNDLYPNFFHFIRVEFYPFNSFGFHGRGRVVVNHDGLCKQGLSSF